MLDLLGFPAQKRLQKRKANQLEAVKHDTFPHPHCRTTTFVFIFEERRLLPKLGGGLAVRPNQCRRKCPKTHELWALCLMKRQLGKSSAWLSANHRETTKLFKSFPFQVSSIWIDVLQRS